jgi:NAD(P)-dependent dehydrogenase (short-subunit alcohol dehydrogenase family)
MAESSVAVVVGVGPGLGAAVARRFARGGFAVALLARRREVLAGFEQEIAAAGGRAISCAADAADPASVAQAFAEVRSALGDPSVLVYNAGAFVPGGILDVTPEQLDACWRVGCLGAFAAAREVVPAMIASARGTILLTGATASLRGSASFPCLAVSKFGLRALGQSLARELGPKGIHVAHVVIDGQIDTPRIRAYAPDRAPSTLLDPEAVAETYWQMHQQHPTAWTQEVDVRPSVERF